MDPVQQGHAAGLASLPGRVYERTMATIALGPIRRLLLLGGGDLLLRLAEQSRTRGLAVDVLTSPRHAEETVSSGRRMADALADLGIEPRVIAQLDKPETASLIGDISDTFSLSIGAAWIFRKDTIEGWFGNQLFNLHGARLPQNRGGGGYSWQILMGNRFGFCQVHQVDGGLDSGPILVGEEFIFPHNCRVPADYAAYAVEMNLRFLGELLDTLRRGVCTFALQPQQEYLSTYWPRLHTPSQAWIDWRWTATFLERFVCAFDDPYSGAQTTWQGRTVRLKRAFASFEDGVFHPFQSGLVYRSNGRWLCIACEGGSLVVEDVRDEAGEDLRSRVRPGDTLATPPEKLLARTQRVRFDALGLKP